MADADVEIAEMLTKNPVDEDIAGREEILAAIGRADKMEVLYGLAAEIKATGAPPHLRRKLPDERNSITHRFAIAGHKGYLTVGLYEDGTPGELFIEIAKEGSTVSGLFDAFGIMVSLALQSGVPLKVICDKMTGSRFDPSGYTDNPAISPASSIMDYVFRWMRMKFLPDSDAT